MTNAQEPRTPTIAAQIEALAACPFCVSDFPIVPSRDKQGFVVICTGCSALGPTRTTQADAIAAWNTRPAIVTALRQAEKRPAAEIVAQDRGDWRTVSLQAEIDKDIGVEQWISQNKSTQAEAPPSADAASDMAAALRNTPADALRETGYLDRAAGMLDAIAQQDMAAFGASDVACCLYPGADQQAERAAFCAGASHGASSPSADAAMVEALKGMVALYDNDEGCRSLPQVKAACAALDLASRQPVGVPEGYVLVPREPTEAMYDAGYDATRLSDGTPQFADAGFCVGHSGNIYRAMIAAAPATDEGE